VRADDTTPGAPPNIALSHVPAHVTRSNLLSHGVTFTESADERVVFDDGIWSSGQQLGYNSSHNYNILLKGKSFGLGRGPHNVTLKPKPQDVGTNQTFKMKLRVIATDVEGLRRSVTRTIQVSP
jgi:hypothetical protein